MRPTHLRHATLLLDHGGAHLLVDPMPSAPGAMAPVPNVVVNAGAAR